MLHVYDVLVLQNGIRKPERVERMTSFVRDGGIFSIENLSNFTSTKSKIVIARFKNGTDQLPAAVFPGQGDLLLLHDGHHRFLSIYLGGRRSLYGEEYKIIDYPSVESYNTLNLSAGWVTPLNIATEVRHADISAFKATVANMPEADIPGYIEAHRSDYCSPRNGLYDIRDLAILIENAQL